MSTLEIVLILALVLVVVTVIYLQSKPKSSSNVDTITILQAQIQQLASVQNEKLDRTIKEINDRLGEQNKTIGEQMRESRTSMQQQLQFSQKELRESSQSTQRIIKEVTEKLVKLDETNKQVVGFAEQMQSLENILRNPKQRGVLGEYFLNTVLEGVLPPDAFKMQCSTIAPSSIKIFSLPKTTLLGWTGCEKVPFVTRLKSLRISCSLI